jgi:uncharacterized protein
MNRPAAPEEELFAIPLDDGRQLLYAPLRRWVAEVNEGVTQGAVARCLEGQEDLSDRDQAAIRKLQGHGLFREPYPAPPTFPAAYRFMPHEVTLFPTSRCNLRCRYCYANAGAHRKEMPWDVARAAIDLVSTNAGLLGSPAFAVGFHGGGEPTLGWDLLRRSVDYAHERAEAMGLDVEVFAATNGLLRQHQRDYIRKHFTTLNVSVDGPPDIHNRNRPKAAGGGSYDEIAESLHFFSENGFDFGIRSTVTQSMSPHLVDIVSFFAAEFDVPYIHFEPVWECGRCLTTRERPPQDDVFVSSFRAAARRGRELNVRVYYSGARIDTLTSKFCSASGDGFTILPEGTVTSCYEITEASDERAAIFHYGRYDADSRSFQFDAQRLEALGKLSVENLAYCRDCFCRWHCAGDCLARAFEENAGVAHQGTVRCRINRKLTKLSLKDMIAQHNGTPDKAQAKDKT